MMVNFCKENIKPIEMPISHNKKIIFIHIPKTGGTSISNVLFDGEFYNQQVLLGSMININGIWRRSSHCTLEEINFIYPDTFKNYRLITVVRNPFDRMVSEFYHLIRYRIRHPIVGSVWNLDFNEFVSRVYYNFEIIQKAQSYKDEDYSIHFLPQSDFIKINGALVKDIKIYRFEKYKEIEKDFNIVEKKNTNHLKKQKEYCSLFDSTSRKMIEELYYEDLYNFNYSYEVENDKNL